jgi:hypothetical protein
MRRRVDAKNALAALSPMLCAILPNHGSVISFAPLILFPLYPMWIELAAPLCGIMRLNGMFVSRFHNLSLRIDTALNVSVCKEYA